MKNPFQASVSNLFENKFLEMLIVFQDKKSKILSKMTSMNYF